MKPRLARHSHLGDYLAVRTVNLGIVTVNYMKYYRIVSAVPVVMMTIPVTGRDMYLHITRPHLVTNSDFGIEKIRTGIRIQASGINDIDPATIDSV